MVTKSYHIVVRAQDRGQSGKGQKKAVPSSFVEVIDTLVDFVLRHQGPAKQPANQSSAQASVPAGV